MTETPEAVTTRTMYDSVNVDGIPADGQLVAVYGNGRYKADPSAVTARFPADRYVTLWIDVTGANADTCQILDVETGDASPDTAAMWVQSYRVLHKNQLGTIYCNASTKDSVLSACQRAGQFAGRDYYLWIASWGASDTELNALRSESGVVAVQNVNSDNYDQSVVFDAKWHPQPETAPAPKPPPSPEPKPGPVLLLVGGYIREGLQANEHDFVPIRLTSTDGGKNWH